MLEVWQLAYQLTLGIYRLSKSFPSDERFGLTDQRIKRMFSGLLRKLKAANR